MDWIQNAHSKTPNVTKPQKQNPQLKNAQCNKTPNATKGTITKRPMLQNTQCYKTPNVA